MKGRDSGATARAQRTATTGVATPGVPDPILQVEDLSVHFPIKRGFFGRTVGQVQAVDRVSFSMRAGETLGLVGESGCGKTTLGRAITRVLDPTAGSVRYQSSEGEVELTDLATRELRQYQREIRVVFQDPHSSLNPRKTLLEIIGDPLRAHRMASGSELEDRVADMLSKVGLSPKYIYRYPHAFSGGERQRINIARALVVNPRVVIADEPVSALDVSVRAQILNLLRDLQEELDLTYLFISHDMSVVESVCDRVAVMYLGRIAELADTVDLYGNPQHPYTEALLSAVPVPDPRLRDSARRIRIADDLPDPAEPPPGCRFHTRCRYAVEGKCDVATDEPELRDVAAQHRAACHLTEQLDLASPVRGTTDPPNDEES